jgi:hypothetical protein
MDDNASDFYGGQRTMGFSKAAKIPKQTVTSPITGKPLAYSLEYLPGGRELFDRLHKSIYNQRSADPQHLTRADVNDIFDEIKATNGNTFEVVGVRTHAGSSERIELLAGLRRTFCCSLLPESQLYIKVFESLSDAEKRHYAVTSDQYTKPNPINRGFSLIALENALKDQGKPASTKALAEIYGISTGSVSEYKNYARQLPEALYALFPGLSFIEVRFLRSMLAYADAPNLADVLASFEPVQADFDQAVDSNALKQACQQLQKQILAALEQKEPVAHCSWRDVKAKKGFKVKVNNKGEISLKFTEGSVAEADLQQLLALVEEG